MRNDDLKYFRIRILGINMIGYFEPPEFERRARYLLETYLKARDNTRILLIDLVRWLNLDGQRVS